MNLAALNVIPALPEIFLTIMLVIVMMVELFGGRRFKYAAFGLTQLTLVGCTLLTIQLFHHDTQIAFNNSFIVDHVACVLKVFIYSTTFLSLLYSYNFVRERGIDEGEYYLLVLFAVLGMMVLVSAYSFITLFIGLELLSLPLYALIAMQRNSSICSEAAMKYFVMGSIASGFLLYGMSMVYGATSSLTIGDIAQIIPNLGASQQAVLVLGLVFIVAAVAFKLGAVPFHMWIPDIYEGSPISVTLIIASASKLAAFGLAVRLLVDALPAFTIEWQHVLMVIAILSMALGNIVAIVQTNIKRMLAYSSIAHIGYMSLGFVSGTASGYGSAMFYIIVYSIMSLGAFGVLALLSRGGYEIQTVEDLRGLNVRNSWLAFLMLLVMFSMAGIPPSAGFFAKIAVLESLVKVHLVWLAALALVFAIVGAYYYLRVVKTMYFDAPEDTSPVVIDGAGKQLGISVNCLLVLALGILPTGLFQVCLASFQ